MLRLSRCLPLLLTASLAACAGGQFDLLRPAGSSVAPTNYKADILAFLRTYLNDPTNIRDTALTQPMVLPVGSQQRHVVCVRFNAKNSRGQYAGLINTAAVFNAGKLDRFIDLSPDEAASDAPLRAQLREPCQTATYQPFPELQQLTR
jgi:hypothetical protein